MARIRIPFSLVAAVVSALLAPISRSSAQQFDPGAPSAAPVPGFESVNVGGRSLRYRCSGVGTPVVIIEAGGGTSLETVISRNLPFGWAVIVPAIAKTTRVCVYDRAGLGRSDKAPVPRTSLDVAKDLHALLEKAHVSPPYVLAGQSFGGMNARMFAHLYPEAVAAPMATQNPPPVATSTSST